MRLIFFILDKPKLLYSMFSVFMVRVESTQFKNNNFHDYNFSSHRYHTVAIQCSKKYSIRSFGSYCRTVNNLLVSNGFILDKKKSRHTLKIRSST